MNKTYKFREHVTYQVEGGAGERLLIIPVVSGIPNMTSVLCLADTSLEIWKMISCNYSTSQITTDLSKKYNREIALVENDVTAFINKLLDAGFISAE